jgi:hypothetical protein
VQPVVQPAVKPTGQPAIRPRKICASDLWLAQPFAASRHCLTVWSASCSSNRSSAAGFCFGARVSSLNCSGLQTPPRQLLRTRSGHTEPTCLFLLRGLSPASAPTEGSHAILRAMVTYTLFLSLCPGHVLRFSDLRSAHVSAFFEWSERLRSVFFTKRVASPRSCTR